MSAFMNSKGPTRERVCGLLLLDLRPFDNVSGQGFTHVVQEPIHRAVQSTEAADGCGASSVSFAFDLQYSLTSDLYYINTL